MPSTEERVIEIVCENLAVSKEQVNRNTAFIEDIGADSSKLAMPLFQKARAIQEDLLREHPAFYHWYDRSLSPLPEGDRAMFQPQCNG